jgi:BirA family biotin operon repressor/biotin-[acetyl-CoA-carboxylase] ligase
LKSNQPDRTFRGPIHRLEQTTSTNDVAARLAETGAPEGTVVIADVQTAGRGRHGRTWNSPAGAGLYMSLILRPAGTLAESHSPAALLTLASGVAVAEAVRARTGLPAEIKWPNDVLVGKRKLAGILAEAAAQAGVLHYVILGIGLNILQTAFPPDLAGRATSIEAETSRSCDRDELLDELLDRLARRYADLQAGRFDAILSAWRALAPALRGSFVEWDTPEGVVRGRAEDIDDRGALVVHVGGRVERLLAGEVRWV